MFSRVSVIALLTLSSALAFAIPKPSEVKAAFTAGNYAKAESLLLEVMKERPTAVVHYQLGQVYAREGKHAEALNEYHQAQVLDPSLKFASSASVFMKNLSDEQVIVAGPTSNAVQPVPSVAYSAPREIRQSSPEKKEGSGNLLYIMFGTLLVLALLYGFWTLFSSKKEAKAADDEKNLDRKQKTDKLLSFSKSLEDALLIAKTATYNDIQKKQIIDRIVMLQAQVRAAIGDLKDGTPYSAARMASLEGYVNMAVDRATNGDTDPIPSPSTIQPVPNIDAVGAATLAVNQPYQRPVNSWVPPAPMPPAPIPQVVHHYHNSPTPAPIVVQNDGFLTGLVVGEMLSRPAERTVYVERERPVFDAPRRDQDTYSPPPAPEPAPAPMFDSNDDRSDSYTSSSDSSFDSGSSGGTDDY